MPGVQSQKVRLFYDPTTGERGLQIYQLPRPPLVRAHIIDDDGNPRPNLLLGHRYLRGAENEVVGQEIADQDLYLLRVRRILGESEGDIPLHMAQIAPHVVLDLRERGSFRELKFYGGGFPRKGSARSQYGLS